MNASIVLGSCISILFLASALNSQVPGMAPYVEDGCMVSLDASQSIVWRSSCMPVPSSESKVSLAVPARVLNWGSGGLGGTAWQFKEKECNELFASLQRHICIVLPEIRETPHDLFHAHLISFGQGKQGLAAVFHAKEYPRDIEKIKNYYQMEDESFISTDTSFLFRNFIYISPDSSSQVPSDIYLIKNQGLCRELFSPHSVNTLDEGQVSARLEGISIGDVNIFDPHALERIKYNNYCDINGKEQVNSGKSFEERLLINMELDHWIKGLDAQILLYFLTGLT